MLKKVDSWMHKYQRWITPILIGLSLFILQGIRADNSAMLAKLFEHEQRISFIEGVNKFLSANRKTKNGGH